MGRTRKRRTFLFANFHSLYTFPSFLNTTYLNCKPLSPGLQPHSSKGITLSSLCCIQGTLHSLYFIFSVFSNIQPFCFKMFCISFGEGFFPLCLLFFSYFLCVCGFNILLVAVNIGIQEGSALSLSSSLSTSSI